VIKIVDAKPPGPDAYADFLERNLVGMHGTVLYRRDLALSAGGFDTSLRACEDYDFYLRLARTHPVVASERLLTDYRRHAFNMSNEIPRMYVAVRTVLERHRAAAAERPEWAAAFETGLDYWTRLYAERQLRSLSDALRQRTAILPALVDCARFALLAPKPAMKQARLTFGLWRRSRRLKRQPKFGDLARTTPISRHFGYDRGKPVDRRYVESFLATHAGDIRGRVLEIGDSSYTRRFGAERVLAAEVLNRFPGHPATTFVGDLADGADLPSDAFDCIVLTQTLHLLFDMPAAVRTLHRILKPGGVLLATVPWASPIDRGEWGESWYWSVSPNALEKLLALAFDPADTRVTPYGNVQVATAFLYGLAEHELPEAAYDVHDPHCPVIVAGRAVKQGGAR
jgi:SAM-dependent methyltransferase